MTHEIAQAATALLESSLPQGRVGIRLLGVGISQFTSGEREQQLLFDDPAEQKHVQLDATLDQLHARFGTAAPQRGRGLLAPCTTPTRAAAELGTVARTRVTKNGRHGVRRIKT